MAGPSIFPNTSVGTRLELDPTPLVVIRAAALDGVPVDRPGSGIHLYAPGNGALLVGEVAVVAAPDTTRIPRQRRFRRIGRGSAPSYAGKVAPGGWHYTARFSNLADTLPSGEPVLHRGSGGA